MPYPAPSSLRPPEWDYGLRRNSAPAGGWRAPPAARKEDWATIATLAESLDAAERERRRGAELVAATLRSGQPHSSSTVAAAVAVERELRRAAEAEARLERERRRAAEAIAVAMDVRHQVGLRQQDGEENAVKGALRELQYPELVLDVEQKTRSGARRWQVAVRPAEDTVGHLKARLEARSGIPAHQQALFIGDERLVEESWRLCDCGVGRPGTWIRLCHSGKVRFSVRLNPFSVARLDAYADQTVSDVKKLVERRANIAPRLQALFLHGVELPDAVTLRRAGIMAGSELLLRRADPQRSVHIVLPPPPPPAPTTQSNGNAGPMDMEEVVDAMATGVAQLVERQADLQKSVRGLVDSLDRAALGRPPPPVSTQAADLLWRGRELRRAADADIAAAMRTAGRYRSPLSERAADLGVFPPPAAFDPSGAGLTAPFDAKVEVARRLQQEARRYADTGDAVSELQRRLHQTEVHSDRYFMLRRQMDEELLPPEQRGVMCHYCGSPPRAEKDAPVATDDKVKRKGSKDGDLGRKQSNDADAGRRQSKDDGVKSAKSKPAKKLAKQADSDSEDSIILPGDDYLGRMDDYEKDHGKK